MERHAYSVLACETDKDTIINGYSGTHYEISGEMLFYGLMASTFLAGLSTTKSRQ